MICEKKGILIINICDRLLRKSNESDDISRDNDINPDSVEDENSVFIKDIVETHFEFFKQNELLFKRVEENKKNYSLVKTALFLQKILQQR